MSNIAGQSSSNVRGLYKVICAVWLFMGLAWLAMVLNLVGEFIKAQSSKVGGETKKSKQTEEENNDTDKKSNVSQCFLVKLYLTECLIHNLSV